MHRQEFLFPKNPDGSSNIYLCGHSLGLQPKGAMDAVQKEMQQWANLGVEGWFSGENPWYTSLEPLQKQMATIVGALPSEVAIMNSLTVNLHLMLTSFYRPQGKKKKILVDAPLFPSDLYALKSQIQLHGLDPEEVLIEVEPKKGEDLLRNEDILQQIQEHGEEIALVFFSGVHFLTGQLFDLESITQAAQSKGCAVGFDLAHAAGNVPLSLHDWNVDFAAWCNYKYLCGGPGSVGSCFVHEKHHNRSDLQRLAGWWGNDPERRFDMQLQKEFIPYPGADGWKLSTPSILSTASLKSALDLFSKTSMEALRKRSIELTALLDQLLRGIDSSQIEVITPQDPEKRGSQISIRIKNNAAEVQQKLKTKGVIVDFRKPDVLRLALAPLYNSEEDVRAVVEVLTKVLPKSQ